MVLASVTLKPAVTPPMSTALMPVNPEPLTVTTVPAGPPAGVSDVIVGTAPTKKLTVAEPAKLLSTSGPLVAPPGTPLVAAVDGVVKGAEPKGRYGNWVEIEHPNHLSTVYGHLSGFAPGIAPVAQVILAGVAGFAKRDRREQAVVLDLGADEEAGRVLQQHHRDPRRYW